MSVTGSWKGNRCFYSVLFVKRLAGSSQGGGSRSHVLQVSHTRTPHMAPLHFVRPPCTSCGAPSPACRDTGMASQIWLSLEPGQQTSAATEADKDIARPLASPPTQSPPASRAAEGGSFVLDQEAQGLQADGATEQTGVSVMALASWE